MHPIIIIGSGLAGYMVVKEFRKYDSSTPVMMITEDGGEFYSKPQLSSAFTHDRGVEQLVTTQAESMVAQLNIQLLTHTTVTQIDAPNSQLWCGEDAYPYSQLVLACGAENVTPSLAGDAVDDIISVNSLQDYALFRQQLEGKRRVAIIGAGLVGVEFANDLTNAGFEVSVFDGFAYPVSQLLPEPVGAALQHCLAEKGVQWHFDTVVTAVDHAEGYSVSLAAGKVVMVDVVLSAIGIRPKTALAAAAGLATNNGITVDQTLRTNIANIYALGDCAEVNGLVMQYVAPLLQCARSLAKTLAGNETLVSYPVMPVVLKTPACPVVVAPSSLTGGEWRTTGEGADLKSLYYLGEKLMGFALSGEATKERMGLQKQVPTLLPSLEKS